MELFSRLTMKTMSGNLVVFGEPDSAALSQIERCTNTGVYGVLCADAHKGYAQPIGGVVAYQDRISISGVGFDIGCGNLAIKTDAQEPDVRTHIAQITNSIPQSISFGIGRTNTSSVDHELFSDPLWSEAPFKDWKHLAYQQLGTVGGGNHYVDIFADESGYIWVGVHFGSRGLGHKTATFYLQAAGGQEGMDVDPAVVDAKSALGEAYLAGMKLAGRYAYAGREFVARKVVRDIIQAAIVEEVHNHHNFAWLETHFGQNLWVVRKGATPAFPGQKGFVGGSMGDNAVIVEGVQSEQSRLALYSTIHGAGRIMSRSAAKGRIRKDESGRRMRIRGEIGRESMQRWMAEKNILLIGGDVDEAPQAYRRLDDVLREHSGTIRVLHTLRPLAVAMAGPGVRDPYKD
jgi:tRNA-splicing ligase RtcB (3'-phosphate/5'-hydroxy nucleic acid ligase)